MSEELKACPFCKCTEIVAGKDYTRGNYRVDCLGCSAFITAPSLELAIHDWNTRSIEDELRAELEKRTAELHYANTACMEMKHELARHDEYISKLEAKIPKLNIDLAEASTHAYNGESARMKLEAELARRDEELKITDGLLKEATETIGAVVACCTYNSNDDAKIGIYGVDQKAFTRIDQFITHYNDVVSAGKVSVDVKQVKFALAERKEFCPNCEAETPCTHEAELYACDICGEDFAKYIVSRSANVSDVSTTQDVLTSIKTPISIENTNPDYYKQELDRLNAERRWIPVSERLPEDNIEVLIFDGTDIFLARHQSRVPQWSGDGAYYHGGWYDMITHWMPLPEPPESEV